MQPERHAHRYDGRGPGRARRAARQVRVRRHDDVARRMGLDSHLVGTPDGGLGQKWNGGRIRPTSSRRSVMAPGVKYIIDTPGPVTQRKGAPTTGAAAAPPGGAARRALRLARPRRPAGTPGTAPTRCATARERPRLRPAGGARRSLGVLPARAEALTGRADILGRRRRLLVDGGRIFLRYLEAIRERPRDRLPHHVRLLAPRRRPRGGPPPRTSAPAPASSAT